MTLAKTEKDDMVARVGEQDNHDLSFAQVKYEVTMRHLWVGVGLREEMLFI